MKRYLLLSLLVGGATNNAAPLCCVVNAAENRSAVVDRVGEDIRYFASDELEGRGLQTDGIHLAAERIIAEYVKAGLKPGLPEGSFRQSFDVRLKNVAVSTDTSVILNSAAGSALRLKVTDQFQPLRRGKNGTAAGPLVFIGYGITSAEDNFDEYAGVDVSGKVLVMIRREPQQAKTDGAFQGTTLTQHSYINRKLKLAREHGAAGVIFVNDPHSVRSAAEDVLTPPAGFGNEESGIAFVHVRQSVVDQLLQQNPLSVTHDSQTQQLSSLSAVADFIDASLQPVTQPLSGWTADITTRFDVSSVSTDNLIGVLEGKGDLAEETIIVGAHYDHLGYGGFGSRTASRKGEIHNGADDNATGTAAVLEIMRRMSGGPAPRRRIVFICFSGEEHGLIGSKYYVQHPVVPLNQTVAMLNYDMIGTLRNNRVEVNGVGTAAEFRPIVEAADEASPLDITIVEHPFAGSDHLPFFERQIPVMFCFTGVTSRYHTPDDDFKTINVDGVVSVIDYTEQLLRSIDSLGTAPEFRKVSRSSRTRRLPYLGIAPNFDGTDEQGGVPIRSVRPDSPAAAAGLQVGDVIVQMNTMQVKDYGDLIQFIQGSRSGQRIQIFITRDSERMQLQAVLGAAEVMRAITLLDGALQFNAAYVSGLARPDLVEVRVLKAGICETDLQLKQGYMGFSGVLGHEFAGVAQSGPLAGQRVVGEINCACGACDFCHRGLPRHCPQRTVIGILNHDGAFADSVLVPEENLHAVPEHVSTAHAVFTEPVAAACRILEQVQINAQHEVVIFGDGRLGNLCAQVLSTTGASLSVVGKHDWKLQRLTDLGISTARLAEFQPAATADFVVDCTGSPSGFPLALSTVKPCGTVILKTTVAAEQPLHLAPIVIDEVRVLGSRCGPFAPALQLIADGTVRVDSLITAEYPLEQALQAFQHAEQPDTLKVLLHVADGPDSVSR